MKYAIPLLAALCLLANVASAQSVSDLRQELERERLLTQIANERAERDALNRERDDRRYQNQVREIYAEREEQQRAAQERSSQLRNVNELVNVLTSGVRNIQMIGR